MTATPNGDLAVAAGQKSFVGLVAAVAATGVLVAGCSGSAGPKSTATSRSTVTSPSSAALSKADFLTQMNAVCSEVNDATNKLPQPASPSDFATVIANLGGTEKLFDPFLAKVDALVPRSPDSAQLQAKWVTPEKAELSRFRAAADTVIADARAGDATKVGQDINALGEANSNSAAIASYLTSYGLTGCAALEQN